MRRLLRARLTEYDAYERSGASPRATRLERAGKGHRNFMTQLGESLSFMKRKKTFSFVGIPTRIIERELERRNSLAYARNVNREMKDRRAAAPANEKS